MDHYEIRPDRPEPFQARAFGRTRDGFTGDHDEWFGAGRVPGNAPRKFCATFDTSSVEIRRYTVPGDSGNKHRKSRFVEKKFRGPRP